jgi:hypothetical protein
MRTSRFFLLSLSIAPFLAFGFSTTLQAEDDQRLYRSAYFLGRGDTGLAIADNQDAIIYNPAGIAQGKGIYKRAILASPMVEFSDDARSLAQELSKEGADTAGILRKRVGKNEHVGAYNLTALVLRRAAIGIVSGATTDILVYKSPQNGGLESVDANFKQTNGATFSLAESFWDETLLLGGTFKYLQRGQAKFSANVTDADALKDLKTSDLYGVGTGTSTDLGMMLKGKGRLEPALGIVAHNVGGTKFSEVSKTAPKPDPLLQTVDIGFAVQPGTKISRFRLLGEYWDATNALGTDPYKKIHLGGELTIQDVVGFTAGMAQGWTSGGVYVDLYVLRLDAGIYIQEMDDRVGVRPDKRLFVRLTAGF